MDRNLLTCRPEELLSARVLRTYVGGRASSAIHPSEAKQARAIPLELQGPCSYGSVAARLWYLDFALLFRGGGAEPEKANGARIPYRCCAPLAGKGFRQAGRGSGTGGRDGRLCRS